MRFSKLMALFTLSALVLFTLPALADTYQQFTLPTDGNLPHFYNQLRWRRRVRK